MPNLKKTKKTHHNLVIDAKLRKECFALVAKNTPASNTSSILIYLLNKYSGENEKILKEHSKAKDLQRNSVAFILCENELFSGYKKFLISKGLNVTKNTYINILMQLYIKENNNEKNI